MTDNHIFDADVAEQHRRPPAIEWALRIEATPGVKHVALLLGVLAGNGAVVETSTDDLSRATSRIESSVVSCLMELRRRRFLDVSRLPERRTRCTLILETLL